ncbi:MAG TPA: ABC transporter permease [Candidatus Saccharimonadales bacterium]|nr:ABC transporter permease [Candidatus Saccharimonadales bacterium]
MQENELAVTIRTDQSHQSNTIRRIISDRRAQVGFGIIILFSVLALTAPIISPYSPYAFPAPGRPYLPPSGKFFLGTDYLGEDVFSEIIYGARVSMLVGIAVAFLATTFGTLVGVVAGYYGKLVDEGLMRATDVVLILPSLPLMIILAAYLGPSLQTVVLVLTVTTWPLVARVVRSQTLSLRERPFADSERVAGASDFRIITKILMPNLATIIAANAVLMVTTAIVGEAALDFIGLGDITVVSWGTMLYWAQSYAIFNGAWWWVIAPGVCIVLVGLGFVLISVSIESVFNPRLRPA